MFRRASFIAVAILGVSGGVRAEKLTLERLYAAPDLSGATLRSAQIPPDGRLVAYLRGKPGNAGQLDLHSFPTRRSSDHRKSVV